MNSGEPRAGCSSSGQENGVVSLDPDQPHKKARFPWQIKGKHHLKIQSNEPTVSSNVTPEEIEAVTVVTAPLAAERIIMTEYPTLDLPGPSKLPSDLPGPSKLSSDLPGPSKISSDLPGPSKLSTNSAKEACPLKMQEEMCISRWQSAQAIKGSFDNTINHVIETWMDSPADADQRFLAMDLARIANDDLHSSDENVENEGILMAINAHGLQSMDRPIDFPIHPAMRKFLNSEWSSSSEDCEILPTTTKSDNLQWLFDERANNSQEPANYEPWRPVHEIQNTNPTDQFPTDGEDYEYEFMNTAVIQAIKSKGLMVAGTDFG